MQNRLHKKQTILTQCNQNRIQVTKLRETVLDLVLTEEGVIKAYSILSKLQEQSTSTVAPPTAYRALDFWAEQGVLHKVSAINGYILCEHAACSHEHHVSLILVCSECGQVEEQTASSEWLSLLSGLQKNGFEVDDDHVVLTGKCKRCH